MSPPALITRFFAVGLGWVLVGCVDDYEEVLPGTTDVSFEDDGASETDALEPCDAYEAGEASEMGEEACFEWAQVACVAATDQDACGAALQVPSMLGELSCVWNDSVVARYTDETCVLLESGPRCYATRFVGEGGPSCTDDGWFAPATDADHADVVVRTRCGFNPLGEFLPCTESAAPSTCGCL
jgi:hypothetical protein